MAPRMLHRLGRLRFGSPLSLCICVFLVWSIGFIASTTFRVDGERTFCLFDDAMISMAYARNAAEGLGLVWNRAQPAVEGFTCPLWTLLMVPINWLPIDVLHRSLVVQLFSVGLLIANLFCVRRLVARHFGGERGFVLPAVVLTAFYYPLNHWALVGMETGLQAFLTTLAIYYTLEITISGERPWWRLLVVLTLALLTRPDMALLVAACVLGVAARPETWRGRSREWLPPVLMFAAVHGAYLVFRILYYGDVLPNTYYLKMTGTPLEVRIARGAIVFFGDFVRQAVVPLTVLYAGAIALWRSHRAYRLPLATVTSYFCYSIYVGGDAWEWSTVGANRFVSPVMPLVFVMLTGLFNVFLDRRRRALSTEPGRSTSGLAVAFTLVGLVLANGLANPGNAKEMWKQILLMTPPIHVLDNADVYRRMAAVRPIAEDDALVAVVWAGIPAYFFAEMRLVDTLGYNDRHIARLPNAIDLTLADAERFKPGHMKVDYAYVLGEQRPDVLVQVWGGSESAFERLLERYGYERRLDLWVRADSRSIRRQ